MSRAADFPGFTFRPGIAFTIASLLAFLTASTSPLRADAPFIRGDANLDGVLDLSDPVRTLQSLFLTGGEPPCRDAADSNDDGTIDISDPLFSLGNLFLGGPTPAAPYPVCGEDPTPDALDCARGPPCPPAAPGIRDVLGDCGGVPTTNFPNSLPAGNWLHKVTLPDADALCNDGSPAVLYVRAAEPGSPDEDRWVIYLQGGGSCSSFEECAERWCGAASYDASKMSSLFTPPRIGERGIFKRDPENRFGGFNQVYIYYCSSDAWSGRSSDVVLADGEDADQAFSLHFRGHSILEAAARALLAGALASDDEEVVLPSIQDASLVLLTGFSAGSSGVQRSGDWLASFFDAATTTVRLVADGAFGPELDSHPDPVRGAELKALTDLYVQANYESGSVSPSVWDAFLDESCLAYHEPRGDAWRCADTAYVARNFITTPFFTHMDVRDSNARDNWVAIGVSEAEYSAINFAALDAMGAMRSQAVEGALMMRDPGVFSPSCGVHSGLANSVTFFDVTVEGAAGTPRNYHDALVAWLAGTDVHLLDTPFPSTSDCAPGQETGE